MAVFGDAVQGWRAGYGNALPVGLRPTDRLNDPRGHDRGRFDLGPGPVEITKLTVTVVEVLKGGLTIYLGISESDTRKLFGAVRQAGWLPINEYLVTCLNNTRPRQDVLYRHLEAVGKAADRPVLIYNIPYRRGLIFRTTRCWEY